MRRGFIASAPVNGYTLVIQKMRKHVPNSIETTKTIILSGHDISNGLIHCDGIGCKWPIKVHKKPWRNLTALFRKVRIQPSRAQIPNDPPANRASPLSERYVTTETPTKKKIITQIWNQNVFIIEMYNKVYTAEMSSFKASLR